MGGLDAFELSFRMETDRGRRQAVAKLTLFSWGYSGWGSSIPQLLACLAAAERTRGFKEPILVDIRLRRKVRAEGFRENALGEVLGPDRYVWMPALGNANIGTAAPWSVKIAEPRAVSDLIDVAIAAKRDHRRVLFFCACKSPDRAGHCHRRRVGTLALAAAHRGGLSLEVVEWPGEHVKTNPLPAFEVSARTIKAVLGGAKFAAVGDFEDQRDLGRAASLPWGTPAVLRAGQLACTVWTGPVHFRLGDWALPVIDRVKDNRVSSVEIRDHASRYRLDLKLDARSA